MYDPIGLRVSDLAASVRFYRAAVERFYEKGLAAGGRDNGPPGLRADYGPSSFAAFLVDPDGNNVEAVYLAEEK